MDLKSLRSILPEGARSTPGATPARAALLHVALLLALLVPPAAQAAGKPATTLDEADSTWGLQGEYVGEVAAESGVGKFGAQVIYEGNGKFVAHAFPGGLPGDGWTKVPGHMKTGTMQGDAVVFDGDDFVATISNKQIVITSKQGSRIGVLDRVERTSPTMGLEAPQGAVVLFDGKSADAFPGAQVTSDGLLIQGATSKEKFQSGTLHLEFRTSYHPAGSGQGRSNSGCYLQGRYEVQILDSFGLEGKHNECGGIYSVKDPEVNMAFPPLVWQTYDIDFTAAKFDDAGKKTADARMTVKHNGVLIHEDVPVPHATTAAPLPEGPEPGPVYLQDHGDPVRFRNIWFLPR